MSVCIGEADEYLLQVGNRAPSLSNSLSSLPVGTAGMQGVEAGARLEAGGWGVGSGLVMVAEDIAHWRVEATASGLTLAGVSVEGGGRCWKDIAMETGGG